MRVETEPLMNRVRATRIYFLVATSDVAADRHQVVKELQSTDKFDAIARLRMGHGTCVLRFAIVAGTSRINNPGGDVYESRDRFEGGCRGSRGGTCRLSGSEAPPGGCRRPQVTGSEAAVRCGGG